MTWYVVRKNPRGNEVANFRMADERSAKAFANSMRRQLPHHTNTLGQVERDSVEVVQR